MKLSTRKCFKNPKPRNLDNDNLKFQKKVDMVHKLKIETGRDPSHTGRDPSHMGRDPSHAGRDPSQTGGAPGQCHEKC